MHAARKIRKLFKQDERDPDVIVLVELADALDRSQEFAVNRLYQISARHFELALDLLRDWRLGQHTVARGKLAALIRANVSELD